MKKTFTGLVPLVATAIVEIEAETEDEALQILHEKMEKGEVDLDGYDPEPDNTWWVEEE